MYYNYSQYDMPHETLRLHINGVAGGTETGVQWVRDLGALNIGDNSATESSLIVDEVFRAFDKPGYLFRIISDHSLQNIEIFYSW